MWAALLFGKWGRLDIYERGILARAFWSVGFVALGHALRTHCFENSLGLHGREMDICARARGSIRIEFTTGLWKRLA